MDRGNTAPSIPSWSDTHAALEQDSFHDRSTPSTPLAGQSGTLTPIEASTHAEPRAIVQPVTDELERFRSEWKKEVEARGHAVYAQPPVSAFAPSSSPAAQKPIATVAQLTSASSSRLGTSAELDAVGNSGFDEQDASEDHQYGAGSVDDRQYDETSLPFPEAAIYAPAALKYSKGSHKIPRSASKLLQDDLPVPIFPEGYHHSPPSSAPNGEGHSTHAHSKADRVPNAIRNHPVPSSTPSGSSTSSSRLLATKQQPQVLPNTAASTSSSQPIASRAPRLMATHTAPALASEATQAAMRSAVEAYAYAVEMERSGQLDQALGSYRRAFKLNSNADRLYHRAHLLITDPALANTSTQQNDALLSSPAIADKVRKALDFDDHRYTAIKERQAREAKAGANGEVYQASHGKSPAAISVAAQAQTGDKAARISESRPDELAKLLDDLSIEGGGERDFGAIAFAPEDEEEGMPIAKLPDEVLLHILRMLVTPRGRRGAKVVKPKPTPEEQGALDAATAALIGRGDVRTTAAASDVQKSTKVGAATTVNAVKADKSLALDINGKEPAAADTTECPTDLKRADHEKVLDNSVGIVTRRQPLGIGVVLGGADWQSLEILGRTCWKFRLLTKSPSLWREIVRETYYPPIIDPTLPLSALYERHHSDWRTTFINQPRVRLNGCYIAACHYARPGLSEDAWVRVIHVVEFYRSIRFLPDGTALSLLTTDAPSETVRKLEPGLKAKGFSKGRWELFDDGLEDDEEEGRPKGPKVVVEDLRDKSMQKYAFRMVFGLRSTTRGRWNKLDLLEYYSVNLTNGEVLPLPQKHSRPFHFSRVVAYGV